MLGNYCIALKGIQGIFRKGKEASAFNLTIRGPETYFNKPININIYIYNIKYTGVLEAKYGKQDRSATLENPFRFCLDVMLS